MQRRKEPKSARIKRRGFLSFSNKSTGPLAGLEDANSGQRANTRPKCRSTNAQDPREVTLRWQTVAGSQLTALDHIAKASHDLLGGRVSLFRVDRFKDV